MMSFTPFSKYLLSGLEKGYMKILLKKSLNGLVTYVNSFFLNIDGMQAQLGEVYINN